MSPIYIVTMLYLASNKTEYNKILEDGHSWPSTNKYNEWEKGIKT